MKKAKIHAANLKVTLRPAEINALIIAGTRAIEQLSASVRWDVRTIVTAVEKLRDAVQ